MNVRYCLSRDVLFTQLDDGSGVLLHLGSGLYYTLNQAGVAVWKAVGEGQSDITTLAKRLSASFDVDMAEAEREATRLLGDLQKDGLIK